MSKGLNVLISTGDQELNDINQVFLGNHHLENTRLRSSIDLRAYTGDRVMPVILLSHANIGRFKESTSSRLTGQEVISILRNTRNLNFENYSFIFLAGCDGAAGTLYVDVAKASRLPTLAATTQVNMTKAGSQVTFQPMGQGVWKVFDPSRGLSLPLSDPSCAWFRQPLNMMEIFLRP
ncbi:MAG: hypothetical protein H6970_00965 [Gammaproteobacteria bacterium]|nr:hypothetical protein [Gammaproteobacteria bacterium]MCP5423628.1 hypothetical protein [Gammaproteobacteria bacterium]